MIKYIAQLEYTTSSSKTFTLSKDEVISTIQDAGYAVTDVQINGVYLWVMDDRINTAETAIFSIDPPITYTLCGAPSNVKLSATQSASSVTLSWSAGSSGTNNTLTGYVVTYQESANGSTWYEINYYGETTGTSMSVSPPSTDGYYRRFGVQTKGSAGENYYSTVVWSGSLKKISYTAPTAPTSVSISSSSVAPGAYATLSWSGAAAGTNNAISGYHIYRSTSASGTYSYLSAVSTTATSGSTTVTASTTNGTTYYYKVYTLGAAGINSGASSQYASLTASVSACTAPTAVSVSSTNVAPGASVTLSWSGAAAGTNNAITGYTIYRATSASGSYSSIGTVSTSATSGTMSVTAPTTSGSSYYYKVSTTGTVSGYSSGQSSNYATLTCTYSAPTAPTKVTLNGAEGDAYVVPGASVTLAWEGASNGTNNAITGYAVYQSGAQYNTTTTTSMSVPAHSTAGNSYTYTVYAKGTYGDSPASAARTVYSYSDPTAPTKLSVSTSTPDAGGTFTLSWSGAAAGNYNAITGYLIYRATTATGTYTYLQTVTTTATNGSCALDAPTANGSSYYYKVYTAGARSNSGASESIGVTAKSYTKCTAPGSPALSAVSSEGENVTLSWTAGSAGTNNTVTGYEVQRREKTPSADVTTWAALTTTAGTSLSVAPPTTAGSYYEYRVRTRGSAGEAYYSDWVVSSTTLTRSYTACSIPETFALSSTLSRGDVTLSWSASDGGYGNAVVDYEIQCAESADNSTWGNWTALATSTGTSLTVTPPTTAGNYYQYRIRARGAAGASYYSDWKVSDNTLRKDFTACGAPTTCTLSATLSAVSVTLSWGGATGGDGNAISRYDIQRCESADGKSYGEWADLMTATTTSTSVSPASVAGVFYKYRVRAVGAAGTAYASGWTESDNALESGHVELEGFTDPVLIVGETKIKAIHITELQERVNQLLGYYGRNAYDFTPIVAGTTLIRDWSNHVMEIREAIDSLDASHEAWIAFTVNCPRADVMQQMRDIVLSI